ncbi:unnamed protein product [Polarella glacialis]|uniref:Uncharacterized protein n=1 Tax=Polarella glacialis TaxID=89957 RepID=A0A813GTG3_POLGL|nr:unnamed protein product [Polarella glacialis]
MSMRSGSSEDDALEEDLSSELALEDETCQGFSIAAPSRRGGKPLSSETSLAESLGEELAGRWRGELPSSKPPATTQGLASTRRRENNLTWRERKKAELERARSLRGGKAQANLCERFVMFCIVFACLLLISAELRLVAWVKVRDLAFSVNEVWDASSGQEVRRSLESQLALRSVPIRFLL